MCLVQPYSAAILRHVLRMSWDIFFETPTSTKHNFARYNFLREKHYMHPDAKLSKESISGLKNPIRATLGGVWSTNVATMSYNYILYSYKTRWAPKS